MVKMAAPKGVTQVSVEQQNFKADKDGYVVVPEHFVPQLKHAGFKEGPFRIELVTEKSEKAQKSD